MTTPPLTSPRRLVLLSVWSAGLGLVGGFVSYGFLRSIAWMLSLTLLHHPSSSLPQLAAADPGPALLPIAIAGGAVVAVIARWEPTIRGHGIPEAMEAVVAHQSRISLRTAVAKPTATALAIGTGAPFGAEGPIIVTGGALGSLLGQVMRVSPAERKVLLASGAAAGMAGIFGTPIGSVLLAVELLLFEYTVRAFVPLVIAAVFADSVHGVLIGKGPLFAVPAHLFEGFHTLPYYALLGLACGVLAVVLTKGLYRVEDLFEGLPIGRFWHPVLGASAFACIGLVVPRCLGVGYDVIGAILSTRLGLSTVAAVFVAKLLAWWVAMGSGTSGSSLAPVLLIGSAFGSLVGAGLDRVVPTPLDAGAFALVGMAATFGAAAGAPFTSIVLVFEMTRDFNVIAPMMLATVVADLFFQTISRDTLMTEKLARRGIRVATDYKADILPTTLVADVMTTDVATLPLEATVADVRHAARTGGADAHVILDRDGRPAGIVTIGDLLRRRTDDAAPAATIASRELVTVTPTDTVLVALHRLVTERIAQLAVVDDGRFVGLCSRADVLRAREGQARLELVEAGWLVRLTRLARRRRGRPEP